MKSNRGPLPQVGITLPRTCPEEPQLGTPSTRAALTHYFTRSWMRSALYGSVGLGLLLGGSMLYAQSTFGSVRGIVQDNTSASVSGSTVTLHSTDENTDRTLPTDATGNFDFENVKAGNYTVLAHHDGFADTVISAIALQARQDLRLAVTLS